MPYLLKNCNKNGRFIREGLKITVTLWHPFCIFNFVTICFESFSKLIIGIFFLQHWLPGSSEHTRDLLQNRLTFTTEGEYTEDRCDNALYDGQVLVPVVTR